MASIWQEIRQTFQRNDRIVTQLIIVNVAVFLLLNLVNLFGFLFNQSLSKYLVSDFLSMPANVITLSHQPWTILTYMFLHLDFLHILFNMLWFYWFGKIFIEFLGNKKILPVYLLGGVCGGLLYFAAYQLLPVFAPVVGEARAMGASASVLAIIVATATLVPDYTILLFFFGAVKIKWIALASIVLDLISIPQGNAGGHIAHLGGALFGFIYIKQLQSGRDLGSGISRFMDWSVNLFKSKPHLKVSFKKKSVNKSSAQKSDLSKQQRINSILDKISESGYEALSKEEKDFLFSYSKENQKH